MKSDETFFKYKNVKQTTFKIKRRIFFKFNSTKYFKILDFPKTTVPTVSLETLAGFQCFVMGKSRFLKWLNC